MSRNLMVLFLLVGIICVTVMSGLPPPRKCEPPPEICKPKPLPPPPPPPCKPLPPPPPPPKCPKNENFSLCGAACQPTCKNPNPKCPLICIKGCVCNKGLLRNKKNKCVEPCDC